MNNDNRRMNHREQFKAMFPNRYHDYSPFLLSRPTPIYQPSNVWNFANPPLRFKYLPQNNVLFESPQTPQVVRVRDRIEQPERTDGSEFVSTTDNEDFEKLPTTDEQFIFAKDVEFQKWENMVGMNERAVKNVEAFGEIFSPTMFLRDKSPENCKDIIHDIQSLTHLDTESLEHRLSVANETLEMMKKENETGINSLRDLLRNQLGKFDEVVVSTIRETHELAKKTEEGLKEKRGRMNFRIVNERAPFARILIYCRDVLEIIFPFLHVDFLITKISPVCSYFLNFVEKRIKLDFIFREESLFLLFPVEGILSKYRVCGLKYFNYVDELRESSFQAFVRIVKSNNQNLERISIFPPFNVTRNQHRLARLSGKERWARPSSNREGENNNHSAASNQNIEDIQFQRTDPDTKNTSFLEDMESQKEDEKLLREAVSTCHRLKFLEMVEPPAFTHFHSLEGLSLAVFRTVDMARLHGLRFNYLFFPGGGVSIEKLIEHRKNETKSSVIGELERLVEYLEGNKLEFLNLTKKRLSENSIVRYAQVKEIVIFARPYLTSIFSHVERFANLSELILPFFDGLELYTESLIQNLPRFIVTMTKFQCDSEGRGWRRNDNNRESSRRNSSSFQGNNNRGGNNNNMSFDLNTISRTPPTPEIINRFLNIEEERNSVGSGDDDDDKDDINKSSVENEQQQRFATPEEFSRSYYLNLFSKKVDLIRKVMSGAKANPSSRHHHISPAWKDTFSICYDETLKHEVEEIRQWLTVPNICIFMNAEIETLEGYEDLNYLHDAETTREKLYVFDMIDFSSSELQGSLERVKKYRIHFRESVDLFSNVGFQNLFRSRLKYLSFVISDDTFTSHEEFLFVTRCILRNARLYGHWLEKLVILIVDPEYQICERVWEELIDLVSTKKKNEEIISDFGNDVAKEKKLEEDKVNNCKRLKILEIRPPTTMKGKYFCFKYFHKVRIDLMVGKDRVEELYRVLRYENEKMTNLVLWKFTEIQQIVDDILRQKFLLSNNFEDDNDDVY